MWYKYLIPRRVFFLNTRPYRWLNLLIFNYPRDLVWKPDQHYFNQEAYIPFTDRKYEVGPTEHGDRFCFVGPALKLGFRETEAECIQVCETHYKRNFLGLSGILN